MADPAWIPGTMKDISDQAAAGLGFVRPGHWELQRCMLLVGLQGKISIRWHLVELNLPVIQLDQPIRY